MSACGSVQFQGSPYQYQDTLATGNYGFTIGDGAILCNSITVASITQIFIARNDIDGNASDNFLTSLDNKANRIQLTGRGLSKGIVFDITVGSESLQQD
jgi:hypothetical protein